MIYLNYFKNLFFFFFAFSTISAQESWSKILPTVGTFSSPRVTDLNNDGVGDVILGAGRFEFMACDSAVVALSGKNGDLLWAVHAKDQIFGSATLKDINNDGVKDVFISGRSAELLAINGKSGEVIWRFEVPLSQKEEWFNFYNPQFITDQNDDGFDDILVSNGGDVRAAPYDDDRPTSFLVIIDGQNGQLIKRADMPDGRETYMSVSVLEHQLDSFKNVIYGTGGETVGGSLFVTSIAEILDGDLSHSVELDRSESKGFIGPAVWVDINEDNSPDIIANAVDGRLLAFDGITHEKIWSLKIPNTEAYTSIAVGNFTNDNIPDFFVSYAEGVWPKLDWSKQVMVNGKNGKSEYEDDIGYFMTSTPVVADFTNDGRDDALMSVNFQVIDSLKLKHYHTGMAIIDFSKKETIVLELDNLGHNIASTPWVGDMDNNGYLDIIYVHGTNSRMIYNFDGMQISRIDSKVVVKEEVLWGAYMGSDYNGVFHENKNARLKK